MDFKIFDDSGLLSIVDCSAYASFVAEDWEYETLLSHFSEHMNKRSMLVWDCGDGGGPYFIRVKQGFSKIQGVRELIGPIKAINGQLHIVSYDALTMAAQYEKITLPMDEEKDLCIGLNPGDYLFRIVQLFDPKSVDENDDKNPHFLLEYESGRCEPWEKVAWL